MTTHAELDRISARGQAIWVNERYNSRYVIDRPELIRMLDGGQIPVVHVGQPEAVDAIRSAVPEASWTVVELRCSRTTAHGRIEARATGDTAERLDAWDATPALRTADLTIDTERTQPQQAAAVIRTASHLVD
ncbi:kinase [Nocardia jiangxiensis]|uniref:kinase n=1 Tax=Nocardia jiangxiensis TaxID=282685 RepID=UPI001FDF1A8F|nr:kinase [Nocardia jiangxiensis]